MIGLGEIRVKSERYAFILVSDEKNWNKLCGHCSGRKGIISFVRKSVVAPVETQKLLFYVKKPIMQIRGVADFFERQTGEREELWRRLGRESCFQSFDEYLDFIQGREKATFVRFKNFSGTRKSCLSRSFHFRNRFITCIQGRQIFDY